MKRYGKLIITGGIVFVIILSIVLVIMLHLDKTVCKNSIKEDNYNFNNTYTIYSKNNYAKKVIITKEINSKNNTILSFFEKNYKDEFEKYDKEYGGYKITSKDGKNKKTVIIELNLGKVKMKKLLEGRSYLKDDVVKNKKIKVEGIYKLFQLSDKMCKK